MDTKALRQKILDLAIRGKLVPQDPNDEPASVLLERIHAEKQQMVKDGKLKPKDIKNDTVIFKGDDNLHYEKFADGTIKCIEDEIPFDVPDSWQWCRGCSCFRGMESLRPKGKYFDYIDIDAIDNKNHKVNAVKHILVKDAPSRASRKVENGSVLFSFVRPYLENIAYINEQLSHCIASTGFYVCNSNGILNSKYMFVLMTSNYVIDGLNKFMKGDNSPSIRKVDIENFLFPVPPLSEQQRIVEKITFAIPIMERLHIKKNDLQKEVIAVKSKILDLAIRGKLVPQGPNDEPASVLLEHIRAEKEELIKQGKIKRNKKESVIFKGSDNSYYEKYGEKLPSGWVITNFETLLSYEQPTNYIVKDTNYNSEYETPVLTAGKSFILGYTDEKENIFSELPVIIFDDFTTESKFVDFPFKVKSSAMKILHINTDLVLPKFAFYLMQATQIDHDNHQRYWISTYSREEIALPPLKEQERILSALEQYFKLLNCLL